MMDTLITPTPAPTKRSRRKEARPAELLEAALALFVEKGFAATRVDEVAARAGVSKGTLFLYFPSKEALFKAAVHENAGRHLTDALIEVAACNGSSAELIRTFLRRWWMHYGGTRAAGLSKLILSEGANFPELAQYYQDEVVGPTHEVLRRVIQRGIDSGEFRPVNVTQLVHLIIAPLIQIVAWRYSLAPCCPKGDDIDSLALVELHADMLLRGLQPEQPAR